MLPTLATVDQLNDSMETVKPQIASELKKAEKMTFATQKDMKRMKDNLDKAIAGQERTLES
jgi:hypothetical protein